MIKQGVILASGLGSRLNSEGRNEPKPLMTVGGTALIERVVSLMRSAGIEHIVIVLGYRSDQMINFIRERKLQGIVTVINEEYNKKNGISLLKSREALKPGEPFLLSMSDHIFSNDFFPEFIKKAEPCLTESSVILSVDRNIEGVFDLDDATKVFTEGDKITKISKDLKAYNAIDTGLFLCSHDVFSKLEQIYKATGDVSISDGMKALADESRFTASDMTGYLWQDVDTPSMKNEAEQRLIDNHLRSVDNDFFSASFFNRLARESALYVFSKERPEFKMIEPAFFILAVFISILSARLQIVWPSIFTLFIAVLLHHFDLIKKAVSLRSEDDSPFFLFSIEVLTVISVFPAIFDTYLFISLITAVAMLFVLVSPFTGFSGIISQMVPDVPAGFRDTWFSPSFFVIVYSLCVIFCIPSFIISLTALAFLVLRTVLNNKEIKENEPEKTA